jgi:hypothetical protein
LYIYTILLIISTLSITMTKVEMTPYDLTKGRITYRAR